MGAPPAPVPQIDPQVAAPAEPPPIPQPPVEPPTPEQQAEFNARVEAAEASRAAAGGAPNLVQGAPDLTPNQIPVVVKPGESLWSLTGGGQQEWRGTVGANGQVANPDLLRPGQVVFVETNDPSTIATRTAVRDGNWDAVRAQAESEAPGAATGQGYPVTDYRMRAPESSDLQGQFDQWQADATTPPGVPGSDLPGGAVPPAATEPPSSPCAGNAVMANPCGTDTSIGCALNASAFNPCGQRAPTGCVGNLSAQNPCGALVGTGPGCAANVSADTACGGRAGFCAANASGGTVSGGSAGLCVANAATATACGVAVTNCVAKAVAGYWCGVDEAHCFTKVTNPGGNLVVPWLRDALTPGSSPPGSNAAPITASCGSNHAFCAGDIGMQQSEFSATACAANANIEICGRDATVCGGNAAANLCAADGLACARNATATACAANARACGADAMVSACAANAIACAAQAGASACGIAAGACAARLGGACGIDLPLGDPVSLCAINAIPLLPSC